MWYPRHALQLRIGLFFSGASLAYGFSGLLSFAIGFMDGIQGLQGWSWIFVSRAIFFLRSVPFPVDGRGGRFWRALQQLLWGFLRHLCCLIILQQRRSFHLKNASTFCGKKVNLLIPTSYFYGTFPLTYTLGKSM